MHAFAALCTNALFEREQQSRDDIIIACFTNVTCLTGPEIGQEQG